MARESQVRQSAIKQDVAIDAAVRLIDVSHRYGGHAALDKMSVDIPAGVMAGIIGADGMGKSTMLSLVAGFRKRQSGDIHVLGEPVNTRKQAAAIAPRIAFMPQGLGSNLYGDLSVRENLLFFANLFDIPAEHAADRASFLLERTGLAPFAHRHARNLSGGMKQKLGLCCALIHEPELLVLDEPTTGVDPLSRREFWSIIDEMRKEHPGMTVLVATAYMGEAEGFDWLALVQDGHVVVSGAPGELKKQTGTDTLNDALLKTLREGGYKAAPAHPEKPDENHRKLEDAAMAIEARGLTRKFGDFTAVDSVDFAIKQGEIFGFLGPNGCGKTTTMKMLTGLLPASAGEPLLFGEKVKAGSVELRRRLGYMSQAFSLYGELSVTENLILHAGLYNLAGKKAHDRIRAVVDLCALHGIGQERAADLPVGHRQRLSLAVAILHEPDILILDEPTSGADLLARELFWDIIIHLAWSRHVTVFITTHYIDEAMHCDRVALMNAGSLLDTDTPRGLMKTMKSDTLEDAFAARIEQDIHERGVVGETAKEAGEEARGEGA